MSKTKITPGETPSRIKYDRHRRIGFGQITYWADSCENDLKIFEMEQQSDGGAFGVERIRVIVSQAKALFEKISSSKEEIGLIDDSTLLTTIIYNGSKIIGGKLDTDHLIEATSELSEAVTIYNYMQKKDAESKRPRNRKSVRTYIRKALQEMGKSHYVSVLSWLAEHDLAYENNDTVVCDGKSITIKAFENAVRDENKKLSETEK